MVRILHFADLHLGVENYGRTDPTTGLHSRLLDFLRSFDELISYALDQHVDLVIFAGDAYKNRDPSPTHQREFATRIHRLTLAGIPVFLLAGNHDLPGAAGRANTLDIFSTLEVPGVWVGRTLGTQVIPTPSGQVQVLAVPWLTRTFLLRNEQHRGRPLTEVDDLAVTELGRLLAAEANQLNPGLPTVVAVHGSVLGASYGSERSVMLGQELILPRAMFRNQAFDYVALGHIHRYQKLEGSPLAVYSGSVDRVDFGEEAEPKGFIVAEVRRGEASYNFVSLRSTRRFITVEVVAEGDDPTAEVGMELARHDLAGAIVRLIIHTSAEKSGLLRDGEIQAMLAGAFKVAAVVRDVKREARIRLGSNQNVEQLPPLEALEIYLRQARGVPENRVHRLMELASTIIGPGQSSG
jgi:exonuclease SbcD